MEEELEDWAMAEEVKRSFNQDAKAENKACLKQQTYTKEDNTSRNSRNRKGNQTRARTAIRSWS
jgi:hypothetical protein